MTTDLDISSLGFWSKPFVERDEAFAILRRDFPVSWHPPIHFEDASEERESDPGFWAVTRAADINFVSHHHELFSSAIGSITTREEGQATPGKTFLGMDPPDHTVYRNIMSLAFTPKGVAKLTEKIEERAEQIVSKVVGAGEFDFVERVSSQLPMMTIADMVGVPESQIEAFTKAGNNLVNTAVQNSDIVPEGTDPAAFFFEQVTTLANIGLELVRLRREKPQDDIATALAVGRVDGEYLSDEDIVTNMIVLSVAGNDTTKHATSWTASALCRNPEQADYLRDDYDGRIGLAVDEFVRYATPVMTFARTATQDTELAGQRISAGDKVAMWYCSGNRDESLYPDPHRFDVSRPRTNHVAFGGRGVHYCLGNVVAKAQLRAIIRQVLVQLPNLEIVGEPQYMLSEFFNGIASLPVRV